MARVKRSFYLRPTLTVAKDLLGKNIVRKIGNRKLKARIVETEAYLGPKDMAAHTFGGKVTKRNKTVFKKGGHIYIYLCYGLHWQLNFVTRKKGVPECILIRAAEPVSKRKIVGKTNGPGKLCRWFGLDKSFDKEDLVNSKRIWLETDGDKIKKSQILSSERIGIEYAKEWARKPWRFYLRNNSFVSRK